MIKATPEQVEVLADSLFRSTGLFSHGRKWAEDALNAALNVPTVPAAREALVEAAMNVIVKLGHAHDSTDDDYASGWRAFASEAEIKIKSALAATDNPEERK